MLDHLAASHVRKENGVQIVKTNARVAMEQSVILCMVTALAHQVGWVTNVWNHVPKVTSEISARCSAIVKTMQFAITSAVLASVHPDIPVLYATSNVPSALTAKPARPVVTVKTTGHVTRQRVSVLVLLAGLERFAPTLVHEVTSARTARSRATVTTAHRVTTSMANASALPVSKELNAKRCVQLERTVTVA